MTAKGNIETIHQTRSKQRTGILFSFILLIIQPTMFLVNFSGYIEEIDPSVAVVFGVVAKYALKTQTHKDRIYFCHWFKNKIKELAMSIVSMC